MKATSVLRSIQPFPARMAASIATPPSSKNLTVVQDNMFEHLFTLPAIVRRHREAPLAREREAFLFHLHQRGTGRSNLRSYASLLNRIICLLGLEKLRGVRPKEVRNAARRWVIQQGGYRGGVGGPCSEPRFVWIAQRWLRFHKKLLLPYRPRPVFADKLEEYEEFMKSERGLAPVTIHGRLVQTAAFLTWFSKRQRRNLCAISLKDVDKYLAMRASGWTKVSLTSCAAILRAFFRYAETRGWCAAGIAGGVKGPPIRTDYSRSRGPKWSDVLRLLHATKRTNPVEARARPILLLFALYGLRRGEVRRLLLSDFDWRTRTFTVHRSKRGGFQQFPIHRELADAIFRYIRKARPQSSCRHLFVSFHPPYGPIHPASLSEIVKFRMKRLGVRSTQMGPHSLRRACATELLKQGASLREIADFLGHRDCKSVGIYAKFDMQLLRKIAVLDLCGAL
jgi:integrase/recombinase XerD